MDGALRSGHDAFGSPRSDHSLELDGPCYDAGDLAFWDADNWPNGRAPYRVVIEPDVVTEYHAKLSYYDAKIGTQLRCRDEHHSPSFAASVELWVPDRPAFRGDSSIGRLWWASGFTGPLVHALAWAHREGRELAAERDRILDGERILDDLYAVAA